MDFVVNSIPLVFQLDFLRQRYFTILKTIRCHVTRRFVFYHIAPRIREVADVRTTKIYEGNGVTCLLRHNVGTRKRPVVSSTPRAALSPSETPNPLYAFNKKLGWSPRFLRRPARGLVLKYSVMPDDGFPQRPKHVALYHSIVCYKYSCNWLPSCPLFCSTVTIPTEQSPLFPQTQTLLHFTSSHVTFDVQNYFPLRA